MFVATGNDRFPGAQVARCNVTHRGVELAKPLLDYLQSNFFVTTAGFFDDATLRFTLGQARRRTSDVLHRTRSRTQLPRAAGSTGRR
jgi:hypothetical protein